MDIAVLSRSTKGKTSRYSYPKSNPQPLAIELKVKGAKAPIRKDIIRVKNFLKPGGWLTFSNGMVLVGCTTKYEPSSAMISSTPTGLLFGCLKDNGEPFVRWLKKPVVKASKKKRKNKKTPKKNRETTRYCKIQKSEGSKRCWRHKGKHGKDGSRCGYRLQ